MKHDEIDAQELLRLLDVVDRIKGLDLDAELDKRRSPNEKLVVQLGDKGLAELKRKPVKKQVHWRTKKKRGKLLYHNYRKPMAQMRKVGLLKGGSAGWWQYVKEGWMKAKTPVELTEEEFTRVLWPVVEGKLPMFMRYDTSKPISLTNIWVVDVAVDGKPVLFDGKEYELQQSGYILSPH